MEPIIVAAAAAAASSLYKLLRPLFRMKRKTGAGAVLKVSITLPGGETREVTLDRASITERDIQQLLRALEGSDDSLPQ